MTVLYKTSNAVIQRSPTSMPVWIIECPNPETLICNWLKQFFLEIRFAEMFPNFGQVRIGNIHPFAMLLFQDVMGQKIDLSLFPAVTVSDSSENEDFVTLGREKESVIMTQKMVAMFEGHRQMNRVWASTTAMALLQAAVQSSNVMAVKTNYKGNHNIDFNIWTDNKTMTSMIYEMVKAFINSRRGDLHANNIDIIGNISGRRSGDINVEFGSILYGANITIPCVIDSGALRAEIPWTVVTNFDTQTLVYPQYHVKGE